MLGRVHSIETMGLMDGPGIRFVVFFQGCKLRCGYCQNPDTWNIKEGKEVSAEELLEKALRFESYFKKSGGGITCSGGEPLMQPEFLIKFLKICKEKGLHTIIDTAGFGKGKYEEILKYTDLVILDIKHIDSKGYRELTGGNIDEFWNFAKVLKESGSNLWIRHVVVPGITDSQEHIQKLQHIINNFENVEKVELLPYHTLGVQKYEVMNIPYRLHGINPMCKERIKRLEKILLSV
ncbi:pyruvate formate-lyase-activating protein [Paramaledivibacter caminithermalis]|jgi:pyruvate formate lyase activating enzyme|uniref:Pyruvate formate-lyase-activating enzyme n=1 Tax=Paramaledivibacter caminithermalis (strain DSM 15212 / CIP 107654 / DViRD3) TaxID=1121301 RepID=A0A1M6MR09_PARC5|nr:pyruvate formate-lyase-activating protein [Paramaledivibacter caminithermalis]SHJ85882.1 pyruvate formate lyase activating enzyme [Paramaledivibacter caminithermalis DSM 15212]